MRQYNGKTVMTVLNGKHQTAQMDVKRYAEIIGNHTTARDITTGKTIDLTQNISLTARQTMVLEF